jgi:hypothetical protein
MDVELAKKDKRNYSWTSPNCKRTSSRIQEAQDSDLAFARNLLAR